MGEVGCGCGRETADSRQGPQVGRAEGPPCRSLVGRYAETTSLAPLHCTAVQRPGGRAGGGRTTTGDRLSQKAGLEAVPSWRLTCAGARGGGGDRAARRRHVKVTTFGGWHARVGPVGRNAAHSQAGKPYRRRKGSGSPPAAAGRPQPCTGRRSRAWLGVPRGAALGIDQQRHIQTARAWPWPGHASYLDA